MISVKSAGDSVGNQCGYGWGMTGLTSFEMIMVRVGCG